MNRLFFSRSSSTFLFLYTYAKFDFEYLVRFWFSLGFLGTSFLSFFATLCMGSIRFVKLIACMTVSARSSFFLDALNIGIQCALTVLFHINSRHLSTDTFLRLRYWALPGPH